MSLNELIEIAEDQIGNNSSTYTTWYNVSSSTAWCAIFTSWCADQAGILTTNSTSTLPNIPKKSSVTELEKWYKTNRRNLAVTTDTSSVNYPRAGDLVVIDPTGPVSKHVGIVIEVNNNKITTIEGNMSSPSTVKKVTYTDLYASGYGEITLVLSNNVSY